MNNHNIPEICASLALWQVCRLICSKLVKVLSESTTRFDPKPRSAVTKTLPHLCTLSGILCSLLLSVSHSVSYADPVGRLPSSALDVHAPSARVTGEPGQMIYTNRACSPRDIDDLRTRIVNVAAQEWGFFGMSVLDLTHTRVSNADFRAQPWRRTLIAPDEAQRVASSIAGYWSSTPDSAWILEIQNESWQLNGPGSRWRNPWSAAFISWVMCESGLGDNQRFQRAIAHHSYIDQAILASMQAESESAYRAFNPGEQTILPGDLLCRGSRPSYRSIAERREQLGMGARSHCDIVVAIEEQKRRILLIGGNVRSWVRLKILPGQFNENGLFEPEPYNNRRIFAHLQLQARPVNNEALFNSPTLRQFDCSGSELPSILC